MEHFHGILIGAVTFLIIGVYHPIVIKAEYRWGKGCWGWFLAIGILFSAASIMIAGQVLSIALAVAGFSSFWAIFELFEQENRVLKGWFPENPDRHDYYEMKRQVNNINKKI